MMRVNLPHSGDMVLIDEVLEFGEGFISVKSKIKPQNAFLENEKFYTYKCIEMMAQSLGAYKGLYNKDNFSIGFLLGARDFEIYKNVLNIGDELTIKSNVSMQDESGFGVWYSEILLKDELIAKATLSVLSPSKEQFLELKNAK
ncbi:putative 3-hydroxylacyl-[acp] dehydratase [Campylobacter mucosalis CCUG 21559]|uniref:Putative 3-hydroxylacyl-[acp] dehydratase n=2 Tax=Campylobacter mucosalis TaxID=202 RepID=A0A6G5QJ45_9BACT|nr:putative 3-hydroxylacyl-[acp] dehydratase [Campylobacter mucosalis CCUG 21559]